jgi:hypothetical protein
MGSNVQSADGRVDLRIHVLNDPRNRNDNPRLGKRFDTLDSGRPSGNALSQAAGWASRLRPTRKGV